MHRRFPSSVILVLLIGGCGFGQVNFPGQNPPGQYPPGQYPPGQYPPGQYPPGQGRNPQGGSSNPFPGRKKNTSKTQEDQVPVQSLSGILRRLSSANAVIESEDKRIITVSIPPTTKYYKASEPGAASDFQPGDHVTVEATRDDNGFFHATKLIRVKPGTADERAAALEPVDASPLANRGNAAGSDDDSDRPRLHRAPSEEPAPKAQTAVADPAPADAPQPAQPDPDDPGPPQLKRGSTARRTPREAQPEPQALVKQPPSPSNSPDPANKADEDPVIAKAREAAFTFSQTLPSYMVKQFTTRYRTDAAHRGQTSWQALDSVTADVVAENGKESYKNVLVNGKAPKEGVEQTGLWSTGDFAVTLQDVLSLSSDADFHNKRAATIVNRAAFRYDYSVDQPNSHWHVYASAESYMPEYSGAIWIDKENYRVLRIEMSARNMPKAFPLDSVESAVDYDYVLIGNTKFLLPVRSEGLNCWRGTSECLRNVVEFRNYRKFGADTSVTFEATPDK